MSWMDTINVLRLGKADWKKAAKVLAFIGLIALIPGLGITIVYWQAEEYFFREDYFRYIVAVQISVDTALFLSAFGLYKKTEWGRRLAQISIAALFILGLSGLIYKGVMQSPDPDQLITYIGGTFVLCFYGVFAFYSIKYLAGC